VINRQRYVFAMRTRECPPSKESARRIGSKEIESALTLGEWAVLDSWLAKVVSAPVDPLGTTDLCCSDNLAACLFNALFFRTPDHPQLGTWAERARETLGSPPPASNLTLARRLMYYDTYFGRPARNALLISALRLQGVHRLRTPALLLQWELLLALHKDSVGEYSDCLDIVLKAKELANRHGIQQWSVMLRSLEVTSHLELNDLSAACRAWEAPLPAKLHHGLLGTARLHQLGVRVALAKGNSAMAQEHAEAALHATTQAGAPLFHALTCITAAEVYLERDDRETAETLLVEAEQIARTTGSVKLACLGSFARAWRALKLNILDQLDEHLRNGFGLAARHGYQNFSWWSPRVMKMLCVKALENGIEVDYVQELVQKRGLGRQSTPVHIEAWPWAVKIYSLGRFTILIDNQPVSVGRKAQHKPLELLKAIISQGGRDVSEEFLTSALWPDAEGDAARQAFDTTLHRLRKLLVHEQAIHLRDRRISLDPNYCWVDVWALERLMSEADTTLANTATDENGTALANLSDRIHALYHGRFLGKEFNAAWAISLRERLRSRYLRHILSVGARWQQLDRWGRALECYRKGLEVDDLAEQLYLNLMLCHERLGQRSEALSVYRRCRFVLSVVLGIAPSSETESLHRRLRLDA